MEAGVQKVDERRARWFQVSPQVKSALSVLVNEINQMAAESGSRDFRLTVREFPSQWSQLTELQVSLGNIPTRISVDVDDGKGRGQVVERGAVLRFTPDLNGIIRIIAVNAQLEFPEQRAEPRTASTLTEVEPEALNNTDLLMQVLEMFLKYAAERHWAASNEQDG
jgi:hypothetical protein